MIAQRRHHAARLKAKRKSYHGGNASASPVQLGKTVHTPARCSCYACGNPRKWFGEATIQERRQGQPCSLGGAG